MCVFKDDRFNPVNAELKVLGDIGPGESRSAEFYLYPQTSYVASSVYAYPYYGYPAYGFGLVDEDKISIRGTLSAVNYAFKLNYPGRPQTEGR